MYAVTMKNTPITVGFAMATIGQFTFGIYTLVSLAKGGAEERPQIPLDAYHTCLFAQRLDLEIVYVSIPLLFDFLAFSLTLLFIARSKKAGFGVSILLKTIAEDATRYFFFIFTFQLILVLQEVFYRRSPFLSTSAFSNLVFLPVMISRLFLSLRKAADSQPNEQSPTGGRIFPSMAFVGPQRSMEPGADDIPLHTYPSAQGTSF